MGVYEKFADIYDELMFDVPYEKIADIIDKEICKNNIENKIILDLACGTGTLTNILNKKGYEMIGADYSYEMLIKAREKNPDVLFLNQSMDEFELYGTVGAIVCCLDSINYLTDDKALDKTFNLCNNYLEPDGLLIFDVNSEYKFKNVLKDNIYTFDNGNIYYTWENNYVKEEKLCDFYLTFFVKEENQYKRFDEIHTERCYKDKEISKALKRNGFSIIGKYDGFSRKKANKKSERILYVCKNTDSIQLKNLNTRG